MKATEKTVLPVIFSGILLLILMLCFFAKDTKAGDFSPPSEIINEADVFEMIKEGNVLLVDNRPASLFMQGTIGGAVNLPYYIKDDVSNVMTRNLLIEKLGEKKKIIFFCSGRLRAYHALNEVRTWNIPAELFWFKDGISGWHGKTVIP